MSDLTNDELKQNMAAVRAQNRQVVALPARHVERPHAVLAHVAESHRVDRLIGPYGRHCFPL
jgi:hypothetical protein